MDNNTNNSQGGDFTIIGVLVGIVLIACLPSLCLPLFAIGLLAIK